MSKEDKKEDRETRAFEEPEENPESLYSWEDLDERREKALALHTRGKSTRAIAKKMGVSHGTISRDIKLAKESGAGHVEDFNREEYLAETITGYKDIVRESWRIYDNSDIETRLKALNMVRLTLKDMRQALQDTGPLKKEPPKTGGDQVSLAIIGGWTKKNVNEAVHALLGMRLNTQLEEPEPPEEYEHEIIDIEEDDIKENEDDE